LCNPITPAITFPKWTPIFTVKPSVYPRFKVAANFFISKATFIARKTGFTIDWEVICFNPAAAIYVLPTVSIFCKLY